MNKNSFKYVDTNNFTVLELVDVINSNIKTEKMLESEIEVLQKNQEQEQTVIENSNVNNRKEMFLDDDILEEETEDSFEDEIYYYLDLMKQIDINNLENEIDTALPVKSNYNYKNILLRLKAEYLKEIKEIKELMSSDKSLSKADILLLKDELLLQQKRIKLITEYEKQKEKKNEENELNNLIFVPTKNGNIKVLDEIKHIDAEYYDGFIKLFDSIKDGTLKNVKRFVQSNSATAGFCEVKDFKIRVVFDRVGPKSYAIISAFVKKSDNDKGYIEPLKRKIAEYKPHIKQIKENLKQEDFIRENDFYAEELYNLLGKEEIKQLVKAGE